MAVVRVPVGEEDGTPYGRYNQLKVPNGSLTENVDGSVSLAISSGGTPGGSNTQVQFNDSSSFGGDAGLTYDKTADQLTLAGSLVTPTVIGGTSTTSDLNLQTTSGVGATGADMHFLVGNNGATEAMTILNSGNVGIGTNASDGKLHIKGSADDQQLIVQANATQTTNLFELKDSAGALLGSVDGSGNHNVGRSNTAGVNFLQQINGYAAFGQDFWGHGGWSKFQWRYSYQGTMVVENNGTVVNTMNIAYNRATVNFNYDYSTYRGGFQIAPTNFTARPAIIMTTVNEVHPYGDFRFRVLSDWTVPTYQDFIFQRDASFITPGKIGVVVTSPTAMLHLPAGTTAANTAPLKFTTGTSLTTAVAGAMEFTTDDLFFTITTGTARKRLLMADAVGGLTATRVAYATTNGRLTDAAGWTFDGTSQTLGAGHNLVLDTGTGTKIGTATTQKIGLWNATPIVQPTTAVAASTFVANTSGIANDTATFDGYTIGQVVKALRNIGVLA